jgi:hypothetical protein
MNGGDIMSEKTYKITALVGNGTYNGIYFPAEEIKKAYKTMNDKPFVLDHSLDVEDEIGFNTDSEMVDGSLVHIAHVNEEFEKSSIAVKHIDEKFKRDLIPNVSVAAYLDVEREETEDKDGEPVFRYTARNIEFFHNALVTYGACSDEDGCGVHEDDDHFSNKPSSVFAELGTDGDIVIHSGEKPKEGRMLMLISARKVELPHTHKIVPEPKVEIEVKLTEVIDMEKWLEEAKAKFETKYTALEKVISDLTSDLQKATARNGEMLEDIEALGKLNDLQNQENILHLNDIEELKDALAICNGKHMETLKTLLKEDYKKEVKADMTISDLIKMFEECRDTKPERKTLTSPRHRDTKDDKTENLKFSVKEYVRKSTKG